MRVLLGRAPPPELAGRSAFSNDVDEAVAFAVTVFFGCGNHSRRSNETS
jgi:hypothetical protein